MIKYNFRPIPNNPFGTKFTSRLYFGRSIKQEKTTNLIRKYLGTCPKDSFYIGGTWHPKVSESRHGPNCERHELEVESADFDAPLEDSATVRFDTLAPDFAERFGGGHYRWANVVNLRCYDSDALALSYPSNLDDRTTPRLFQSLLERPVVSREGWVIGQRYKGSKEYLKLSDGASAICEWLDRKGVNSKPSGAGRIAKQMIESLGGLWGTHMVADKETISLLNSMATQEIVAGAADEATRRQFQGRTVITGRWKTLVARRAKNRLPRLSLEAFAECGVLKLGLGIDCPNCSYGNWYGLDQVDYEVVCERCLKPFRFPQGDTTARWKYRVTGPFSVPNYAEGAYSVALTLNLFQNTLQGRSDIEMTYATGLELKHDDFTCEVDFAFWFGKRRLIGQRKEPRFIVGEAKSFAGEAIKERDVESLKRVAKAIPGTVLVVSVLKEKFSEAECDLLTEFTRWGWSQVDGRMRAPVILVTGVELFAGFRVRQAWNEAGDPYPKDADYEVFNDLHEFAFATQKTHLGLDFYAELHAVADVKQS